MHKRDCDARRFGSGHCRCRPDWVRGDPTNVFDSCVYAMGWARRDGESRSAARARITGRDESGALRVGGSRLVEGRLRSEPELPPGRIEELIPGESPATQRREGAEWHIAADGHTLPPDGQLVLVRLESRVRVSMPDGIAVGYVQDRFDWIVPGLGMQGGVVAWCDCLPSGFEMPL